MNPNLVHQLIKAVDILIEGVDPMARDGLVAGIACLARHSDKGDREAKEFFARYSTARLVMFT